MGIIKDLVQTLLGNIQPYTISKQVAASASGDEQTFKIEGNGIIQGSVELRLYSGAELDLRIKPMIRSQEKVLRPIIALKGKDYIDGDDDIYRWVVNLPVFKGEYIVLQADNVDAVNAFDYRFNFSINYSKGLMDILFGR